MVQIPDTDFVSRLRWRVAHHPSRHALTFLPDGEGDGEQWTYEDLDSHARGAALALLGAARPGDGVLLLYPAGLSYVATLVGCLYAGLVPVPAYPPRNRRHLERIDALLRDAGVSVIASSSAVASKVRDWLGDDLPATLMGLDPAPAPTGDPWLPSPPSPEQLALLQYTSGSTGHPKGVQVTHRSLMANQLMIQRAFGHDERSGFVSWLPLFHDMGLIGNLLQPLYLGSNTVLMPPTAFIQKPVRWLDALSRHRAHTTGAPNFAYELCVRAIGEVARAGIDLSSVAVAYCGSEPVSSDTLDRFAATFAPWGFRASSLMPCYGLAEATLLVSSRHPQQGVSTVRVDATALETAGRRDAPRPGHRRRTLVSCGRPAHPGSVTVVDPETRMPVKAGTIGEIWVTGPHVASGYRHHDSANAATFTATTAPGEGPYLRTGDLGCLHDGELYVTGRLKDIIIVRGRNFHPHDLERTATASHAALEPAGGIACALDVGGEQRLALIHEVRRTALKHLDGPAVAQAVRRAVFDEHGLSLGTVVLIKPASLPRTSSGKPRRVTAGEALGDGSLATVYEHRRGDAIVPDAERPPAPTTTGHRLDAATPARAEADRLATTLAWLRTYAERRINVRQIDERRTIPPYVVLDLGNHGILGLQAPLELGGLNLSNAGALAIIEQLSAIDATLSSFVGVHNALGLRPLLRHASAAQQDALLADVVQGRQLAGFAFTEPGAGSNPTAIATTATPDGPDRWTLRGSKKWTGTAGWAGYLHVFAHMLDEDGNRRGITAFTVPQLAPGLRQGPDELTLGMRGMVQNKVILEDVPVTRDDLLGAPGRGMTIAHDIMQFGRVCIAAGALGVMKRSLQLMVRYGRHRQISTGRLLDNALWRTRLTGLTDQTMAVDAFVRSFASWLDTGIAVPEELYAAIKVVAPEAAGRATDQLVQMLGGRGYIETNLAPQLLRDARLFRIFEGPTETMSTFVGLRLARPSPALDGFLRDTLGADRLSVQLHEAGRAIERRHDTVTPMAERSQRVAAELGELGVWALWLAVVEWALETAPRPDLQAGRDWVAAEYDRHRATLVDGPPRPAPLSADTIETRVAAFGDRIGDLDPESVGELQGIDPLLRRAPAAADLDASRRAHAAAGTAAPTARNSGPRPTPGDLEAWIAGWIAERLNFGRSVAVEQPFSDFGLDSLSAVEMTADLGDWLGDSLSPTLVWDHPNIRSLAQMLGNTSTVPPAPAEDQLQDLSTLEMAETLRRELTALEQDDG